MIDNLTSIGKSCIVCKRIEADGYFLSRPEGKEGNVRFCFRKECQIIGEAYSSFLRLLEVQQKRLTGICIHYDSEGYDCKRNARSDSSYCNYHQDDKGCSYCGRLG